jgi:predicted Zn-dependent protease
MFDGPESWFHRRAPDAGFCSLRLVHNRHDEISVRNGVLQPLHPSDDVGAMIVVVDQGGWGYGATSDLSDEGLEVALQQARNWARRAGHHPVVAYDGIALPHPTGSYASDAEQPWDAVPLAAKIELLRQVCDALTGDERIVDRSTALWRMRCESLYLTNGGGRVDQVLDQIVPDAVVVVADNGDTQVRSFGSRGVCRQGGLEVLGSTGYLQCGPRLVEQALELLAAPDCPTGAMDLLLAPDQMLLQIHESIGHPLELDRILGDERNYAGTSFVTPEMFGTYRYGSELLNVTFDPEVPGEFAGYAFDDDGAPAERQYLIREGMLERGLGGSISQARSGLPGVANSRATSWNRPPIDRMANLNVEAGDASFDELVGRVERGVYMETNTSWSIDDSRNKFQFGCEYGRLIEDGELTTVVCKPNYRGISESFWRNLVGVGDASTVDVLGSPYCGKGEPNQVIRVGHASPACLFAGVEVFGGA